MLMLTKAVISSVHVVLTCALDRDSYSSLHCKKWIIPSTFHRIRCFFSKCVTSKCHVCLLESFGKRYVSQDRAYRCTIALASAGP